MKITTFERYLAPTGRVLMGMFFILAGVGKLADIQGTAAYIESVGLPFGGVLALIAAGVELTGGFMLLTGFMGKMAALLLALFVLIVTIPFHGFRMWADDPVQQVMFMKNIALMGALLFMAAHVNRVADTIEAENEAAENKRPTPTL